MKAKNVFCLLIILGFFLNSCTQREDLKYIKLAGFAQGTSYHVTYGQRDSVNLQPQIDSLLEDFDHSLSGYDSLSLISRINRNETDSTDQKFREVYSVAERVNRESGGAFDITVMPLVNAWGFGPGMKREIDPEIIDSIRVYVGMDKIKLVNDKIVKKNPGVSIDLNAIAQGYSVDLVSEFIESKGIGNYMVEIGGEVKTRGKNPKSEVWKIGIDRPEYGNVLPGFNMQAIIQLNEKALATSGNYRKFFEDDGVKYSHSIDPETGYPVKHSVLSATIIAESCMEADAYATACMILGLEKAKELITNTNMEAYLIYGDAEGQFQVWSSDGFRKYIVKEDTQPSGD